MVQITHKYLLHLVAKFRIEIQDSPEVEYTTII